MKKSLFKKPAWSMAQPSSDKDILDGEDLFRRSEKTYSDVLAEKERQKRERQARKERERLERETKEESRVKRRRTSESDGRWSGGEGDCQDAILLSDEGSGFEPKSSRHVALQGEQHNSTEPRSSSSAASACMESKPDSTSSLTGQDLEIVEVRPSAPLIPVDEELDSESDEEFRELKRKARERARLQKLGLDKLSPTPGGSTQSSQNQAEPLPDGHAQSPSPIAPHDPIVQIFLTSAIPNTAPLIVARKLSQTLREVRLVWCKRQNLPQELADTTFLSWKGNRLWDVSTCKSLRIGVDDDGGVFQDGDHRLSSTDQRIHIEVTTPEIFEAERQARLRQHFDDEDSDVPGAETRSAQDAEPQIRITLKSKGLDEVKVMVKPTTAVAQMIRSFRSSHQIGADKQVILYFDGGRLEPESTVIDCDLDDMDRIDVIVR